VHGKGSLLDKMPGDFWQKFANLRLLLAYMYAQSGKKLLFMGAEFAQWDEWKHDFSLDWHLVQYKPHMGVQTLVSQLNRLYRNEPAMHELDADHTGFRWVNNDPSQSIMAFARRGKDPRQQIWAIFNLTPVVRLNYRIGVPNEGGWHELLNTDAHEFGGSGQGNWGRTEATPIAAHGYPFSVNLTLPPLAALFLKAEIV
jgi:1,4-alpha-glucan branching enzyme